VPAEHKRGGEVTHRFVLRATDRVGCPSGSHVPSETVRAASGDGPISRPRLL
jgi:hypothetical protein